MEENIFQKITLAVLFGSQATGRSVARSDYDVAYLAPRALTLGEESKLAVAIARIVGTNEDAIDLIDMMSVSPLLQFEIAMKGRKIYGSDRAFMDFRLNTWKRYQHTAKFRRFRERVLAHHYGN